MANFNTKSEFANGAAHQTTSDLARHTLDKVREIADAILPPSQRREQWVQRVKHFVTANPKLSVFILANALLSGGPILLFAAFATTVLLVSIVSAVVGALIFATVVTISAFLLALCVLVPVLFVTTGAAVVAFGWGLVGYYVLRWMMDGDGKSVGIKSAPIPDTKQAPQIKQVADVKDHEGDKAASATDYFANVKSAVSKQEVDDVVWKHDIPEPRMGTPIQLSSPQPISLTA